MTVQKWKYNIGQVYCEQVQVLGEELWSRYAGGDSEFQVAQWLEASTTGERGAELAARGHGNIRHGVLSHVSFPPLVYEEHRADEHYDSQRVVRREKADQEAAKRAGR
jgi:hypothetical protein